MLPLIKHAITYNAWATKTLIDACRTLEPSALKKPGLGYGSIIDTLNHIVISDAVYLRILEPHTHAQTDLPQQTDDLGELESTVRNAERRWHQLIEGPIDLNRTLVLDKGTYRCAPSVVLVQAFQHAAGHREQIRMNLRALGTTPPDLQPWQFALDADLATATINPDQP